jgi:hypothetical protein
MVRQVVQVLALGLVLCNDPLAGHLVANAVFGTEFIKQMATMNAEAGLERVFWVVETAVDDLYMFPWRRAVC